MRKLMNNPAINQQICIKNSICYICVFIFLLAISSANIYSQDSRPTPTPKTDIPVVVSRDIDSTESKSPVDVRESVDNSNVIKLPRNNSTLAQKSGEVTSVKQKKMILYLDLLTKTEQRAASLQKQLFELLEKKNEYTTKLKQIEYQLRPEVISSSTALIGSLRPEDLREQRKQALELEKANLERLMQRIDARQSTLEESVRKAEALVEQIRVRFDRILDEALAEDDENF